MSSGFVSGGSADAPVKRDQEWLQAQADLEAARLAKAQAAVQAASGRGLFETLQANKAAKEEAHAESLKLKHQFPTLEQDEIDWLDGVEERKRKEMERVRKETKEGLEEFRKRQGEVDKVVPKEEVKEVEEGSWSGRKRRRGVKEIVKGIKIRKLVGETSESGVEEEKKDGGERTAITSASTTSNEQIQITNAKQPDQKPTVPAPPKKMASLVAYGSDSDD